MNEYMYKKQITRVRDVYGRLHWVATDHLDNPNRSVVAICNHRGVKRSYTKAGRDGHNVLHRDNIAEVNETRELSFQGVKAAD